MEGLPGFQRDLFYVITGLDGPHGLAIKEELEEIEELESAVEANEDDEDLLAAQKEVTQAELERDRLERKRDALADDIVELDSQLDDQAQLEARREEISAELEDLRTRIERLER